MYALGGSVLCAHLSQPVNLRSRLHQFCTEDTTFKPYFPHRSHTVRSVLGLESRPTRLIGHCGRGTPATVCLGDETPTEQSRRLDSLSAAALLQNPQRRASGFAAARPRSHRDAGRHLCTSPGAREASECRAHGPRALLYAQVW